MVWLFALSGSVATLQRIGVRKNQGRSAAVSTCSTSRKSTLRQATSSASPATSAANTTASGIAAQTVVRASGTKISESTIRITSISPKVTAWVATIESATSCRGKRTFLISSALSTIERDADCSETEKKIQQARPARR